MFAKFSILFVLIFLYIQSYAQIDSLKNQTDSTSTANTSAFKISSSFLSNNVYLGRRDIETQSFITTGLGYFHKSGAYINGSISYIPNPGFKRVDRKEVSVGYEYNSDKFYGVASISKYDFNDSSNEINAAINSMASLNGSYNFGFIKLGSSFDCNFGEKTDIVLGLNLSYPHSFLNDKFYIEPLLSINAGSQNFYESYYKPSATGAASTSSKGRHKKITIVNGVPQTGKTTVLNSSKFNIMDYEFCLPMEYTINNFIINFNPVFILPVNPATVVINKVTTKEVLKNAFVFELGLTYRIKSKK